MTTSSAARELAQRFRAGAGDRLGQIEEIGILLTAKILRTKKLLQANNLRTAPRRFADGLDGAFEVCRGIG